jgi:spore coat polysaccharide biosynthesis protein SpsF (cytidylyltransferase family)
MASGSQALLRAFRTQPIYLTTEVWRALFALAQARSRHAEERVTVDGLADLLLREKITDLFGRISESDEKLILSLENDQ